MLQFLPALGVLFPPARWDRLRAAGQLPAALLGTTPSPPPPKPRMLGLEPHLVLGIAELPLRLYLNRPKSMYRLTGAAQRSEAMDTAPAPRTSTCSYAGAAPEGPTPEIRKKNI